MGTTPNYAIPYPEPTDFVADGATQMENLAERSDLAMFALGMGRNRLINGDMRVAQRGTSFVGGANNDNTYTLDRWCLLSDGNDIVDVTQANIAPTGGLFSVGLDVETANKKFGILQVIEQRNIIGMLNQQCTLSFKARTTGTSIANMKAVILSWTGTADLVTRDVVSAWGADGVTPTWAASWTAENTPQNLSPSNTWTTYTITATVDTASTNNLAVFIWCDDMTTTVGDFLYVTDVQLEVGALATPFERKLVSDVLADCQRYFFRWQSVVNGDIYFGVFQPASSLITATFPFPVYMRIDPTSYTVSGFTVINSSATPTAYYASKNWFIITSNVNAGIGNTNQSGFQSSSSNPTIITASAEL
jgi:hypothetical protein